MRLPDLMIETLAGTIFPKGHDGHASSQFDNKRTMHQAQEGLRIELQRIGVEFVILRCDVPDSAIRQDGMLRADARPYSPRVAVWFKHPRQGEIVMPSGRYRTAVDNVWAIVRTLECLRAVERYGVVSMGQQYTGFKALPPAIALEESPDQVAKRWADATPFTPEQILRVKEARQTAYRDLAKMAHADAGGSDEAMTKLNRERDLLARHCPLG